MFPYSFFFFLHMQGHKQTAEETCSERPIIQINRALPNHENILQCVCIEVSHGCVPFRLYASQPL